MTLAILIPAYNEAPVIGDVVRALPATLGGIGRIDRIVVDDGSRDGTAAEARNAGATVLRHPVNRGVGVATATGLAAARQLDTDLVVTMDADGQHDPADLPRLLAPLIAGQADLVVGTRLLEPAGMPAIRRIGNQLMNAILHVGWGIETTDSQSGYRAYSRSAVQRLHLTTGGFEICTEILYAAKQAGLTLAEVPVKTIYTDYSKAKGQNPITAVVTFLRFATRVIIGDR